jgi:signal transduction histidine kinase
LNDVRLIAVDDEPYVLDLYAEVLEGEPVEAGRPDGPRFRIETHLDGDAAVAAVAAARAKGRPFVAGFFDLMLAPGGRTGPHTIRGAREADPELLVCVISGAVDVVEEVAPMFRGQDADWTFLQKPVGLDELQRKAAQMAGQWSRRREAEEQRRRLERELGIAQEKVRQGQALSAIGLVAAGVAHEIKNPLAFVKSNLESLRGYAERIDRFLALREAEVKAAGLESVRADLRPLVVESLEGVAHIAEITEGLKAMSRMSRDEREVGDVAGCVSSALLLAQGEIKRAGATVQRDLAPVPPVRFHAGELTQVLVNLLVNAAQATRRGEGHVRVATRTEDGAAVIEVGDDGCGIPPEQTERIFEAFYTTKPAGQGTGLGLSISADIVRSHGGAITVESVPGEGSTFRVVLPVVPAVGAERPERAQGGVS